MRCTRLLRLDHFGALPRYETKISGERLWTHDLWIRFGEFASRARESIVIFAPYVRDDALRTILVGVRAPSVRVVTTWSIDDLATGASDIRIYNTLREKRGSLYLLPGLHMKALVADCDSGVISTANISGRGLGLFEPANIECALEMHQLQPSEQLWFTKLVADSLLVDEEIYRAFFGEVKRKWSGADALGAELDLKAWQRKKDYTLSALPMCDSPERLLFWLGALGRQEPLEHAWELECVLHDAALFSLDPSASNEVNRQNLRKNFFAHPLIRALAEFVDTRRYFGELKGWLQRNCTDIPTPPRKHLTRHVRTLLNWFVALGDGAYWIDRPHYSECIVPLD